MVKINQNLLNEVNYQKKMIKNLSKWLRNSMVISSFSMALILFTQSYSIWFTIVGSIILVLSITSSILIGFAMKNGQENIKKMIEIM